MNNLIKTMTKNGIFNEEIWDIIFQKVNKQKLDAKYRVEFEEILMQFSKFKSQNYIDRLA
jgi:hypothetical protein